MNERDGDAVEEVLEAEIVGPALAVVDRQELALLDVQIATAKRFPRSIEKFKKEALALATASREIAELMYYQLKRYDSETKKRKIIEGPSVRLAEIVASCWQNLHTAAAMLEIAPQDRYARSRSICWDLERNNRIGVEVARRIVGRNGSRFGDDMVGVTQAAGLSIAFRNSVFKVVPFAYIQEILAEAKLASIGKALTMEQRQAGALKTFAEMRVSEKELLAFLERPAWSEVTLDDYVLLRGTLTALKDGDTTIDVEFADVRAKAVAGKPTSPPAPGLTPEDVAKAPVAAENDAKVGAPLPETAGPIPAIVVKIDKASSVDGPPAPKLCAQGADHEAIRKRLVGKPSATVIICACGEEFHASPPDAATAAAERAEDESEDKLATEAAALFTDAPAAK